MSITNDRKDILGRDLEVGDTVTFTLPYDRGLRIGVVVTSTPIRLTIEYSDHNGKPIHIDRHGRHIYKIS